MHIFYVLLGIPVGMFLEYRFGWYGKLFDHCEKQIARFYKLFSK